MLIPIGLSIAVGAMLWTVLLAHAQKRKSWIG